MGQNKKLPLTETTYYVLMALMKPSHGYLIMQDVEELSAGEVRIAAGTMYGAIENLLKHNYIKHVVSDDDRRKVYVISQEGKDIFNQQRLRYLHMVKVSDEVLKGVEDEEI